MAMEVFDPSGAIEIARPHAPRLDSLDGKMICLLSNDQWQADRTLTLVRELLQEQFPSATFLPHTEFPTGTAEIDSDKAVDLIAEKGGHGVIIGNAA